MSNSALKRQCALILAGMFPVLSGMLWGGFWLTAIAGIEDFSSGFALLVLAYAAGVLLSGVPGISSGKIAIWCIAFFCYVDMNLLFPMAFYFGMAGVSRKRDRSGGRFASGFLSGGLLGSCFGFSMFLLVLLGFVQFVALARKKDRESNAGWLRIGAGIFNVAAVVVVVVMAFFSFKMKARVAESNSGASDITLLCALGSSDNPDARMLSVSRMPERGGSPWFELIRRRVERVSPAKRISGKYDVIIVEDVPADAFNSPRRYLSSLNDDGILVMPVVMCRKIPELDWSTIPVEADSANSYAAAKKSGKFTFSGDDVERNLLQIAREAEVGELLLPGAFSGALVGFVPQQPEFSSLLPHEDFRYLLFGVAALLIALEILFLKSAVKANIKAAQAALAFALFAGVLLSENSISGEVQGGLLLVLLAGSMIFLRLASQNTALRWILVAALAAMWIWFFVPCIYSSFPALLLSGMAFTFVMRHYQKEHPLARVDWQTFAVALMLACGVFLGSSMPGMVLETLLVASSINLWLFIRS